MYKEKLKNLGIPITSRGGIYLNEAIKMYEPGMMLKEITLDLGKKYNTSEKAIYRAMHHALGRTDYFKKISIKEFIGMVKYDIFIK